MSSMSQGMLSVALLVILAGKSATATLFEQTAAASHHLVWDAITLEVSNNKPFTSASRYVQSFSVEQVPLS